MPNLDGVTNIDARNPSRSITSRSCNTFVIYVGGLTYIKTSVIRKIRGYPIDTSSRSSSPDGSSCTTIDK